MIASMRLIFTFAIALPITVFLVPVQLCALWLCAPLARKIPMFWHRFILSLIGARVKIFGSIPKSRPLMIVANHLSWSDIIVLGSTMELCFIAKDEVKQWPGFNLLAWLQRSVFVDRARRLQTGRQADTISSRLIAGDVMVLFAEGTTNDGHRVFPFKSALLGAAQYALRDSDLEEIALVPVAIAYTHLFGMPLGRYHQSQAAWPGDIPLMPHFVNFFRKGAYDIRVCFGEPIAFTRASNRRETSKSLHQQVAELFIGAMQGRELADSNPPEVTQSNRQGGQ